MTSPIRVLIADDHALVREGTRELLGKHGSLEVVAAVEDGLTAVAEIDRLRPDVALVDISMPGLNGIEVTRRVKEAHPEIAILILTVHDEEGYVHALLEAGAAGYLLKDVGEFELVESIEAVRLGESILDPALDLSRMARLIPSSDEAGDLIGRVGDWESPLTDRETEVLRLAARGSSNKQIAAELCVSPRTVQAHLGHIFKKLSVASRTEAVIRMLKRGWLKLDELS